MTSLVGSKCVPSKGDSPIGIPFVLQSYPPSDVTQLAGTRTCSYKGWNYIGYIIYYFLLLHS